MCGIFGFVSQHPTPVSEFHALAENNTVRGNLGFGGCYLADDTLHAFRQPTPYNAPAVPFSETTLALGHIRAPTGGRGRNLAEIHPFESVDLLLAHNGILLNHADYPEWRIDPTISVDSQVIIGGIQTYLDAGNDLISAIQQTVSQLDGQQACWLLHKATQQLYLWRVMSPIYTNLTNTGFYFSSIKTPNISHRLQEGVIYQFERSTFTLNEVATFSYQTPYRIR